jgi:hypothetical protein
LTHHRLRSKKLIAALIASVAAGGCATPADRGQAFAHAHGFEREIVTGVGFRHLVWRNHGPAFDDVMHVYIEGDGTPHPSPREIAPDPTPLQPLMLHLMALDPHPSVYVGRPCYWGLQADRGCSAYFWTLGRFSAPVVDSLVAVINRERARGPARHVVLYGHSGGAALALLAVQRGVEAEGILTIAGNLDPDAWAALHGYTRLTGSLNPADSVPPDPPLPMRHYVGELDRATPVELVRAAARRVGGEVIVEPSFDHQCCWEHLWPAVVEFPRIR